MVTLEPVGFVLLLVALVAIGVLFNKLVLCWGPVDRWVDNRVISQRENMTPSLSRSSAVTRTPTAGPGYVRIMRAILSVALGAVAALLLGSIGALVWRVFGLE